jgi:hypothetical protein
MNVDKLLNIIYLFYRRKRGDRGEIETPQLQIIRQLAVDRAEELKKHVVEYQQRYKYDLLKT